VTNGHNQFEELLRNLLPFDDPPDLDRFAVVVSREIEDGRRAYSLLPERFM